MNKTILSMFLFAGYANTAQAEILDLPTNPSPKEIKKKCTPQTFSKSLHHKGGQFCDATKVGLEEAKKNCEWAGAFCDLEEFGTSKAAEKCRESFGQDFFDTPEQKQQKKEQEELEQLRQKVEQYFQKQSSKQQKNLKELEEEYQKNGKVREADFLKSEILDYLKDVQKLRELEKKQL